MANTSINGEVHVALLQDGPNKYVWSVVHVGPDGAPEIISMNHPNCDVAKSAAWAFAQAYGATFVPAKRKGGRS